MTNESINMRAELFRSIMSQEVPVMENVWFTFMMEDVPVAWREQAVRHRIGTRYGDNYGVDLYAGDDASFWSQSMRIQSMANFANEGKYHIPPTVDAIQGAEAVYASAMGTIEWAYRELVETYNVPMEDARNLIPLGATHRISMTINLRALKGIIGKRGCWILQMGLWGPVIKSMIDELVHKVDPIFRELVEPPCVTAGVFNECKFKLENERRVDGRDDMPICPLYWSSERPELRRDQVPLKHYWSMVDRIPEYAELWRQPDLERDWKWKDRT